MMMRDQGHGVKTKMQASRFQVHTPYDAEFVIAAHRLEGRWRKRAGFWSFPRHNYHKVAEALNRIFQTRLPVRSTE